MKEDITQCIRQEGRKGRNEEGGRCHLATALIPWHPLFLILTAGMKYRRLEGIRPLLPLSTASFLLFFRVLGGK